MPLEKAIQALKKGKLVLVRDDTGDTTKGYLVGASASTSTEDICQMVVHGRAVILVALEQSRIDELGLSMMPRVANDAAPDFALSVEARHGVSTGISAADRAKTVRAIATTKAPKLDLITPGHIFPLRARTGGVLVRTTIAEAATDLLSFASLPTAATLCQCLSKNGELATDSELDALEKELSLESVKTSDIIRKRLSKEQLIEPVAHAKLPLSVAESFTAFCFRSKLDGAEHLALVCGNINQDKKGNEAPVLVRVQAEHRINDLFGTDKSTGRGTLKKALSLIAQAERGVLVYIRHPRAGALKEQVLAIGKQRSLKSPVSEIREQGIGAQILRELGVSRIRLLTNSQREIAGINAFGLEIIERVRLEECERSAHTEA